MHRSIGIACVDGELRRAAAQRPNLLRANPSCWNSSVRRYCSIDEIWITTGWPRRTQNRLIVGIQLRAPGRR